MERKVGRRKEGKDERENEQGNILGGAGLFTLLGVWGEVLGPRCLATVTQYCTVQYSTYIITTVLLHEYADCNYTDTQYGRNTRHPSQYLESVSLHFTSQHCEVTYSSVLGVNTDCLEIWHFTAGVLYKLLVCWS